MSAARWRLRVCYSVTGRVRYISHLDFIRAFERAARRAGLPLALSEGFSPAPKIAYGWPLPVGTAGLGEYLDIELTDRVAPDTVKDLLNRELPAGIRVNDARYVTPHGPSLMAQLDTASYLVKVPAGACAAGDWAQAAERLLAHDRLEVTRERGGDDGRPPKRKTVDLRPLIRRLEVREVANGRAVIYMELVLGDRGTARPEEVVGLLREELGGLAAGSRGERDGPGGREPDRDPGAEGSRGAGSKVLSVVRLGLRSSTAGGG